MKPGPTVYLRRQNNDTSLLMLLKSPGPTELSTAARPVTETCFVCNLHVSATSANIANNYPYYSGMTALSAIVLHLVVSSFTSLI